MKRVLAMIGASALLVVALPAEVRRGEVSMDRVPWELARPSPSKPMWVGAPHKWPVRGEHLSEAEIVRRALERFL